MNYEYSYSTASNVDPDMVRGAAIIGFGFLAFILIIAIAAYVYMAICLMKMAKKTGLENRWMAWIPILNIILLLQIAKKPIWWIILMLIPVVNIIISILVWMGVAKELKKPEWLGVLMIIPVANLIVPGYLAFSQEEVAGK